jgi:AcrR family transcriptional regulator
MAAEMASSKRLPREVRVERILDTAQRLFYPRGVDRVGMDELVRETGLGKATVYRLFPTKDQLVAAYLRRMADAILADIDRHAAGGDPVRALTEVLDAIEADVRRDDFRGCAFNNASIQFDDPAHPARVEARRYREELARRLTDLSVAADPADGPVVGSQLAVLIDGAYTNAAHLGPDGPAAAGLDLARRLIAGLAASR